jgi:osmotically-inducible protein OsmY
MKKYNRSLAILFSVLAIGLAGCATKPGQNSYFDDAMVTSRVKKAIWDEPALKVTDVSVSTENGVVALSGSVKTRSERAKAADVARRVEGVKLVRNELKIQ